MKLPEKIVVVFRSRLRADVDLQALEAAGARMYGLAWRNHPEHVRMQQRGREEFMAEYHIQVCRIERDYSFDVAAEPC